MGHYQNDGLRSEPGFDYDNYEPNGFNGPGQNPKVAEPPLHISGDADRYNSHKGNDDYSQAGNLYRMLSIEERDRMTTIIANTMKFVPKDIVKKNVDHFSKCDPEYGKKIAEKVGL